MSDRAKRRQRRALLGYFLLAGLTFILFRSLGPALVTVNNRALSPIMEEGDVVLARRSLDDIVRGSVVIVDAPMVTGSLLRERILRVRSFRNRRQEEPLPSPVGRPVPRIAVGLPGETVTWDHQRITIDSANFDILLLHDRLHQPETTITLGDEEFFVVSLQPGRADSRIVGPVDRSTIRFHVQSIIWPIDRRGVLAPYPADNQ